MMMTEITGTHVNADVWSTNMIIGGREWTVEEIASRIDYTVSRRTSGWKRDSRGDFRGVSSRSRFVRSQGS